MASIQLDIEFSKTVNHRICWKGLFGCKHLPLKSINFWNSNDGKNILRNEINQQTIQNTILVGKALEVQPNYMEKDPTTMILYRTLPHKSLRINQQEVQTNKRSI